MKADPSTTGDALWRAAAARLEGRSETPSLDAQILLAGVLGKPRTWVLAHPEICLSVDQACCWERDLARLETGEPLPYVLGSWEFYGLAFEVNASVLIPRPETELLVERALEWLGDHPDRRRAVDVGTGTGCIAITLAERIPHLEVTAIDCSAPALETARRNAQQHGVAARMNLQLGDLLKGVWQSFDLVCANLPYIPTRTLLELPIYRKEPATALDGGPDGLDVLRRFFAQAPQRLAPGGLLLAEIEARQGEAGLGLARSAFPGAEVEVVQDLAGLDRLVSVRT
ncbi:MAG: peptide chain release factor N(5)-glutamine methyltransferase [Anaerolineaceae bacterium]|nr:peptide chain release factor N(5)-glutamine methyltransferase [Anaerolineaceae bacterium]